MTEPLQRAAKPRSLESRPKIVRRGLSEEQEGESADRERDRPDECRPPGYRPL